MIGDSEVEDGRGKQRRATVQKSINAARFVILSVSLLQWQKNGEGGTQNVRGKRRLFNTAQPLTT